jgi:hypothetical protein
VELVVVTVEELSIKDALEASRVGTFLGRDCALVFRSNKLLLGGTMISNLDSEMLFRCLRYPKLLRRLVASSAERAITTPKSPPADSGASTI